MNGSSPLGTRSGFRGAIAAATAVLIVIAGVTAVSGFQSKLTGRVQGEWVRTSRYITVRDGTRLAVDIFRPVRDGRVVEEPLPVVWANNRYHRATYRDGRVFTVLDHFSYLQTLLRRGYVVAAADIRGTGASMGFWGGLFTQAERNDAYDLTEWFASQPWSDGRIGMYGRSHLGVSQFTAASSAPPQFMAAFPEMVVFDGYSSSYSGGVFRHAVTRSWADMVSKLDSTPAAPVDEDWDFTGVAAALAEHRGNVDLARLAASLPFRDSRDAATGEMSLMLLSPSTYLREVEGSGVPFYHLTGWFDPGARDTLLWFNNLTNPQKLVIGPWDHAGSAGVDMAQEHLRWYDYWLRGIESDVMSEPPIRYFTIGAPAGQEWRTADQWPLPNEEPTPYYFAGGPSGSVRSSNDGLLLRQLPSDADGQDDTRVDYTATSGRASRWNTLSGGEFDYPDMTTNDQKGLTYTTPALDADLEVTGHPVAYLWVTSTAKDGDFFAYLEDVDEKGVSRYVSEGVLRASHRALSTAPYDNLGLPYHRSFEEDMLPLTEEPAELAFDLMPVSWVFKTGHRIRVTITGADKDNAQTPQLSPPPTISIHRNTIHSSHIQMPIIPPAN